HATLADAAGNVITSGTSYGAGGYGIAALGKGAVLRAGLGARRVEPDGGPPRTPLTAQIGLGLRPGRYTAVGLGYSRTPFDETAGLMQQDLTIDALDWSVDASPTAGWSVSAGGGGAWLSGANRRRPAAPRPGVRSNRTAWACSRGGNAVTACRMACACGGKMRWMRRRPPEVSASRTTRRSLPLCRRRTSPRFTSLSTT